MVKSPRIALLGMGVIGGGPLGQGIPAIKDLFLYLSSHYNIEFFSFKPVDVSRVPDSIIVRQPVRWWLPGRAKYILMALRLILNHLRNPYDLLFGVTAYPTGQYAVILSRIIRRPVIVQFIDREAVCLADIEYGNLCKPWLYKITRWVTLHATAIVVVSDFQRKVANSSMTVGRNIDVLPLRIVPTAFQFREREISFPIQFIHVAYYSQVKDQGTLFECFALVATAIDCHLTVIGSGYNIPEVQELLKQLDIVEKVTFKGAIPYSQIPEQFTYAHIMIHTSRFESCCLVMQEAMASGVAVCGTNVGILADIGDQFGVIVQHRDPALLASKILNLINDIVFYRKITRNAYEWIVKHDSKWANELYRQFIDSVLANSKRK
jgi:glycosyltransferase involved in cell wall biosynthesis